MKLGLGLGLGAPNTPPKQSKSDDCNTKPILCGECDSALKVKADPQPDDIVVCACGNSDTFENVMKIVRECAQEHAARMLQESLKGIASRSQGIEYSGAPVVKRDHRFYINMD